VRISGSKGTLAKAGMPTIAEMLATAVTQINRIDVRMNCTVLVCK